MKHLCHGYADHLVIDELCSYFAQAYTLIQKVASSSSKLIVALRHFSAQIIIEVIKYDKNVVVN